MGHRETLTLLNAAQPGTRPGLKSSQTAILKNVAKPNITEKSNVMHDSERKMQTSDGEIRFFLGWFGVFSCRGCRSRSGLGLIWFRSSECRRGDCVTETHSVISLISRRTERDGISSNTQITIHRSKVTQLLLTSARIRLQAKGGWERAVTGKKTTCV